MSASGYNDFTAFQRIIDIADAGHDGHVTIMKFTTGWKVVFGTPIMDQADREYLWNSIPGEASISAAMKHAIANRPEFGSVSLPAPIRDAGVYGGK